MRGVEQIPWAYDGFMSLAEWGGLGAWRRWLAQGARGLSLDVGCGTGRNLPLYPPGARPVGLDPCFENLLAARKRAPGVPLVQASAEALPFRDGAFDTVVCGLVLCSVPDQARGLAELRRVLAPQGQARMLEHVRAPEGSLQGRYQDLIEPAWRAVTGGCHPNRHTERAVEQAGFRIEPDGRRARANWRRFVARKAG